MNRLKQHITGFLDQRGTFIRLLLLGLGVRVLLLVYLGDQPLVSDALYYHDMASELVEGEHFSTYWPPGLPLYEAGVILIFGKSHFVARLAMLFWFVWLCFLSRDLLSRLHSRIAANVSVLILCLYPAFVFHSVEPLTQLPAATLLLAAFVYLHRYLERRSARWVWRLGLVIGALILVRPSAALLLPVLGLVLFFQSGRLIAALTLALLALTMVGMWIWSATNSTGRFIMINEANARNFYLGNNAWTPWYKTWHYGSHWTEWEGNPVEFRKELRSIESAPEQERTPLFWKASLTHIGKRPDLFLLRSLSRFRTFFAFDSFAGSRMVSPPNPWPVLGYATIAADAFFYMFCGLGWLIFVFAAGRGILSKRVRNISYIFVLMYALPYFTSFSHPTYHMPVMPFMIMGAAIMVSVYLGRRPFPKQVFRNIGFWIAAVIFIAIQIEWIIQNTLFP